jgi:protease I
MKGTAMAEEKKAGDGVSDEELVEQVANQTDSEHEQQDYFERESDGTVTDTEAAKADADDARGN